MAKDPAFLFYYADASSDVSHMNRLERGCYFDFFQAQKKFGPLTIDSIQKILGKDFTECWPALKMCLTYDNDMYFIAWLQDSIEKRKTYSASRSKNRKGSNQSKNKEGVSTYVNHMVNENEIVNENTIKEEGVGETNMPVLDGREFEDYESWTKSITDKNDHLFEQMLMTERINPNGQLVSLARDHLSLLARYPKMRPASQQSFRYSLIKHIKENINKSSHDNKRIHQAVLTESGTGKNYGKL